MNTSVETGDGDYTAVKSGGVDDASIFETFLEKEGHGDMRKARSWLEATYTALIKTGASREARAAYGKE